MTTSYVTIRLPAPLCACGTLRHHARFTHDVQGFPVLQIWCDRCFKGDTIRQQDVIFRLEFESGEPPIETAPPAEPSPGNAKVIPLPLRPRR